MHCQTASKLVKMGNRFALHEIMKYISFMQAPISFSLSLTLSLSVYSSLSYIESIKSQLKTFNKKSSSTSSTLDFVRNSSIHH